MPEDMAPPSKRRKLSSSSSIHRSGHRHQDHAVVLGEEDEDENNQEHMSPAFAHSVQALYRYTWAEPPRVESDADDGGRIAAVGGIEDFKVLLPRQGTGLDLSLPPVTLAVGVQIFTDASTTLTYTPPSTPPSVPGATTFSTADATSRPPSYGTDSTITAGATSSQNSETINPTATSTSSFSTPTFKTPAPFIGSNTTIITSKSSHTRSSVTSTPSDFFYFATFENGDISTLPRSTSAYTTTVDDRTITVDGYSRTTTGDGQSRTTTVDGKSGTTTMDEYSRTTDTSPSTSVTIITNEQSTFTSTAIVNVPITSAPQGYGGVPTSTSPSTSTTTGNSGGGGGSSTPPAGAIAGGVVGGAAGVAVLVLIAMLFLRWYRARAKAGHHALPTGGLHSPALEEPHSAGPGMAERAGLRPFAAAVPALFRHNSRTAPPAESSERGFTRISGRKLPSQWSQGMSSPPPNMPLTAGPTHEDGIARHPSGASFYRDSTFYGSEAGFDALRTSGYDTMIMSPGPERQAQLHTGGPYNIPQPSGVISSDQVNNANPFGRSDTPSTLDPNRGSRFTEDM